MLKNMMIRTVLLLASIIVSACGMMEQQEQVNGSCIGTYAGLAGNLCVNFYNVKESKYDSLANQCRDAQGGAPWSQMSGTWSDSGCPTANVTSKCLDPEDGGGELQYIAFDTGDDEYVAGLCSGRGTYQVTSFY